MLERARRARLSALLLGALLLAPAPALAHPHGAASQYVTGTASFVLGTVYGATKVAFATGGIVVGGLTWLFTAGNTRAARGVWETTMKGTYVLTPEHLRGEEELRFFGP